MSGGFLTNPINWEYFKDILKFILTNYGLPIILVGLGIIGICWIAAKWMNRQ